MMSTLNITVCPNCSSLRIKKVRKTVSGTRNGKRYSARNVEFYECPVCEERVYEPSAIKQIEKQTNVLSKQRPSRKIA
jgi:YgiT-type zinc finger domain-containing protein